MATTMQMRYSAELTYIDSKKKEHIIDPVKISSIMIDYDYENNNMPILMINANIDNNMLDDIITNAEKNTMIFALYSHKYSEGNTVPIKSEYIRKEFSYLIYEEPYKTKSLDNESDNDTINTIYKTVTLGLIDKECSNSRKRIINGVIEGNISSILFNFLGTRPIVMEPIPNNINTKLVLPPMTSTTDLVEYVDKVVPLYSSQYRLFYDFKRTYLLSSSGKCIPIKTTNKNSIHINITETANIVSKQQGMEEMENGYIIYADILESNSNPDKLSGKMFTAVAGVSSKGIKSIEDLNVDKDINSLDNIKLERVHHENLNKVKEAKSNIELSSALITINKAEIDGTVLTLNNEYTIKHDTIEKYNGKYLLARKREIYVAHETPGQFISNVTLSLRKIMS